MKRFPKISIVILIILAMLTVFVSADGEYSSKDDPLVSLSYVNDVLGPEIMAQVMEKVQAEYIKISDISTLSTGSYTAITLTKGQTLMASSCCELIVLDGSATTVITSAFNISAGAGISDLTAGKVLTNGTAVTINSYLVIPKADGRGITVTSDSANILVRGEYNITG